MNNDNPHVEPLWQNEAVVKWWPETVRGAEEIL